MIQSFADRDTRVLFEDDVCHRQWRAFKEAAVRKLDMLDSVVELGDLASPPGNRLERLKGERAGQYEHPDQCPMAHLLYLERPRS